MSAMGDDSKEQSPRRKRSTIASPAKASDHTRPKGLVSRKVSWAADPPHATASTSTTVSLFSPCRFSNSRIAFWPPAALLPYPQPLPTSKTGQRNRPGGGSSWLGLEEVGGS